MPAESPVPVLTTRGLTVSSRSSGNVILQSIDLDIQRRQVTALIGPSGVGKSTFLKCLNRLADLTPSLAVSGEVRFDGIDTRAPQVDPDDLRRRIGIVFQQPVTFPGSIAKNVLFAAKKLRLVSRSQEEETVTRCLTEAGLWGEVKDRLARDASTLSVGQQQRLAIARCLAGKPEVLLMDEPTSALDPRSMAALEETILRLKETTTIVVVTHHLEQARRLADWVACICPRQGAGELIEVNQCEEFFDSPVEPETIEYLSCFGAPPKRANALSGSCDCG